MIAWFPEEGTIRIIGPECFASFNLEGHAAAYDEFRKEQEEKKNEAFLLSHLGFMEKRSKLSRRMFPRCGKSIG